jgi:acyl-CoA thioester hydrolase
MQNINLKHFKFSKPLEIRWNDLDALQHVNNVFYFDYFQTGRGYYMPTVTKQWDWTKNMFVIAHIECDYFKELKLTAVNPSIKMRTTSIKTKSFEIEYLITSIDKEGHEKIHARGKSIQVLINPLQGKSIEIPDWLRTSLMEYEPHLN